MNIKCKLLLVLSFVIFTYASWGQNSLTIWNNGESTIIESLDSVKFESNINNNGDGLSIWKNGQSTALNMPDSISFWNNDYYYPGGVDNGEFEEPTKMEIEINQMSSDEDTAPEFIYSEQDSISYASVAQDLINRFANGNSDDSEFFSSLSGTRSDDDHAQDAIESNCGINELSGYIVEQQGRNSGIWGNTRFGGFNSFYKAYMENGRKTLLVVFYYKGGFPNGKTAYIKLGQPNSGKILGSRKIKHGKEYDFIKVDIEKYIKDYGCVNFFPLLITDGSGARNYLNPIFIKSEPIVPDGWEDFAYGQEFGRINGVSVYCNKGTKRNQGGLKYQCVELCKRYFVDLNSNLKLGYNSSWGDAHMWPQNRSGDDDYIVYENDGSEKVREGDLIVWPRCHIAVVIKTTDSHISIAHQNGGDSPTSLPIGTSLKLANGKIIDEKPGTNKSPIYAKSSEISHFIRINSTNEHYKSFSSSMVLNTTKLNYKEIEVGKSRTANVRITNNGLSDLTISSVRLSNETAFSTDLTECTIGYGETKKFTITFMPKKAENYEARLVIKSDASDNPTWTINLLGVGFGDTDNNLACPDNNHPHAIDLGLPSRVKWSCCNVDASSPEDFGGYYAWGEIEEGDPHTAGATNGGYAYGSFYLDKNMNDCYREIIDIGASISGTEYDVASVKWGDGWRMPNKHLIEELIENTTTKWTTKDGVEGIEATSKLNGAKLFLPHSGVMGNDFRLTAYWGSVLDLNARSDKGAATVITFEDGSANISAGSFNRWVLLNVRPVRK